MENKIVTLDIEATDGSSIKSKTVQIEIVPSAKTFVVASSRNPYPEVGFVVAAFVANQDESPSITISGTTAAAFTVVDVPADPALWDAYVYDAPFLIAGTSFVPTVKGLVVTDPSVLNSNPGAAELVGSVATYPSATVSFTVTVSLIVPATAVFSVAEHILSVGTIIATGGLTKAYSISGGVDASLFAINPSTGALTFIADTLYELPNDTGSNNVYDLEVTVTDGTASGTQLVAVTVTDTAEALAIENLLTIDNTFRTGNTIAQILNAYPTVATGLTLTGGPAGAFTLAQVPEFPVYLDGKPVYIGNQEVHTGTSTVLGIQIADYSQLLFSTGLIELTVSSNEFPDLVIDVQMAALAAFPIAPVASFPVETFSREDDVVFQFAAGINLGDLSIIGDTGAFELKQVPANLAFVDGEIAYTSAEGQAFISTEMVPGLAIKDFNLITPAMLTAGTVNVSISTVGLPGYNVAITLNGVPTATFTLIQAVSEASDTETVLQLSAPEGLSPTYAIVGGTGTFAIDTVPLNWAVDENGDPVTVDGFRVYMGTVTTQGLRVADGSQIVFANGPIDVEISATGLPNLHVTVPVDAVI